MRIIIAPGEPDCVHWVAKQVNADLERLTSAGLSNVPLRIVAGTDHPQVKTLLDSHPEVSDFEGFVIDKADDNSQALVVASNHFRGTIFGLLEISRLLGIDPLEYFTDIPPKVCDFDKLSFPIVSPEPAFRYRGFFINQEDLLAGWKNPNGPVPLDVYDNIFLTTLRMGANTILPGTYLSPDSPILELASKRGLILAQHHFQIVGTDVGRLTSEQKSKYSFVRFPEETANLWRESIRRNRHRETMWTLGYRGLDDQPFWTDEQGQFSDQKKGEVISEAIKLQLRLLQEELGSKDVPCVFYLYREVQILYQNGHIEIPDSVITVWCDNGYGTMESYFRDGYELWGMMELEPIPSKGDFATAWPKAGQQGDGLYYHVSFYDGAAPNRVQYISPEKIQANLTEAKHKRMDKFLLLNMGNIREFVLGVSAVFDFARSPQNWLDDSLYWRKFLEKWCSRYFSEELAPRAANVYVLLYESHWWWKTSPGKCFGDNAVQWMMPGLIGLLSGSKQIGWHAEAVAPEMELKDFVEMIAADGSESMARWEKAVISSEKLLQDIPEPGQAFFHDNVVVQTRRGLAAVSVLALSAKAVLAILKGDQKTLQDALNSALRAMDTWEHSLSAADRAPKWKTWSKADRIVQPKTVRNYLNAIVALIAAKTDNMNNSLAKHLKRGTAAD